MKKIVLFIQNAYSQEYAGRQWKRDKWLEALWESRTGKRLLPLLQAIREEDINVWIDNTTPVVARTHQEKIEPDLHHMIDVVCRQKPSMVVCMGARARDAWNEITRSDALIHIPALFLPHPAYRVLTNVLLLEAASLFMNGITEDTELKQSDPRKGKP